MNPERERHLTLFRQAAEHAPAYSGESHGRGIVTCGSLRFTPYLWILIRSLRHHGCALPVELWHMEGEVKEPLRRWLTPYGVSFRNAGDLVWNHGPRSWDATSRAHGIKPYAIMHSGFREVLYLDADNCVFRDPTFLFETAEYRHTRAIFWPDPATHAGRLGGRELRRDFGLDEGTSREFESGQILIDKLDCWRALALTLHLNEHGDYYYRFLFGDKETFRLAFDVVRQPYLLVPRDPDAVEYPRHDPGRAGSRARSPWSPSFIHYWLDSRPLFHHRVGPKWNTVDTAEITRERCHYLPGLPRELVAQLLGELREHWREVMPIRERLLYYVGRWRRQQEFLRSYLVTLSSRARLWAAVSRRVRAALKH